jgi:titin
MATVTGLTSTRMLAIEAASVISGVVNGSGNLILTKKDGTTINAGAVVGPAGPTGSAGVVGSIWRTGAGAATGSTTGAIGDFYLNTANGDYYEKTGASVYTLRGNLTGPTGSSGSGGGSSILNTNFPVTIGVALSDESTAITATGIKARFRAPYAFTVTGVRLSANTASSSGIPTLNITNGASASLFTTTPTLAVGTTTSQAAGNTASVLNVTNVNITDDELLTYNLATVGTGVTGLKCWMFGYRVIASSVAAPSQVIISSITAGVLSVALTWNAPSAGSSAITGYVVEYKLNTASAWTTFGTVASTTATVTGLLGNLLYDFHVIAVNLNGNGPASITSSTTPTGLLVSTAPRSPIATPLGGTSMVLNWTAPISDGGTGITDYLIEFRTGAAGFATFTDGQSTALTATVTGLISGTNYDFRVSAINSQGTGASVTVNATAATIPGVPTNLTAGVNATTVTLNWLAPGSNGGTPLTDYVIDYRTGTAAFVTFTDGQSTALTATVTGLTSGTNYDFRVYAKNSVGNSATFASISAMPTTAGGTFTINPPTTTNTKSMNGQAGTAAQSRTSPAASFPFVNVIQNTGWQNIGGTSNYLAYQGLIDFPLTTVSGQTVTGVTLKGELTDTYNGNGSGRSFIVEMYPYAYANADLADWVLFSSGAPTTTNVSTTMVAYTPITAATSTTAISGATNVTTFTSSGSNLIAAVQSALTSGSFKLLMVTDRYRLNDPGASTGGGNDEWASFKISSWELTVTTT